MAGGFFCLKSLELSLGVAVYPQNLDLARWALVQGKMRGA
jgi:hypothetical protein